jgi:TonB-dependent starch-binding outer membrane protein SusC
MKKNYISFRILFLMVTWLFAAQAFAQDIQITGKVSDARDGSSLPGATVQVKGTTNGTLTDLDGKYAIKVKTGEILTFSFIGYDAQEVTITGQKTVNVSLQQSSTTLEQVVVIGYGQVRKTDATGSINVLGSKDFNKGAISSPQELLVGKSTGVVITSSSGAPGAGSTIPIRGGSSLNASNDPLIVIDGVPIDNGGTSGTANGLAFINPNDIESFTVLKDASATAIYGSRASNGVILITTKKGVSGKKMELSYNGQASIGVNPNRIETYSGDDFKAMVDQKYADGLPGLNAKSLTRLGAENTDWQKQIYQTAVGQDHNLSLSGTVSTIPYRVSLGYTNKNGTLKTTDFKRNSIAVGLTPSLLDDHLKININFKGSATTENFGNSGAIGSALAYDPTQPVMNGNTRFGGYHTWTNLSDTLENGSMNPDGYPNPIGVSNPVALLDLTDNIGKVKRSLGNIQFDYKFHFLPDLRANLNLAYDRSKSTGHNNAPDYAAWTFRSGGGQKIDYTQDKSMKLFDFYLNYSKELPSAQSKFDLTGGYSWQHFKREGSNYSRNGDETTVNDSSNYITENFLVSFFGRLNYTFMDRYLLTFTLRDDGSSKFKNNKWGLFPSAAFAWKLKEESFLKDVESVSEMKLRLGWGKTGQQDIGSDYPSIAIYRLSEPTAMYQFGSTFYPTLRPDPYDANLKWESTTTLNVGIDFGFAENRFTGAIDLYKRVTDDLLAFVPIPAGSNFSNYLNTNVGSLENKGVEFNFNWKPIVSSDMIWNIGYNISYNKNEITKLLLTDDPNYTGVDVGTIGGGVGNTIQNQNIGFPANSFYVFQQVYASNGMPIEGLYVDRSGEGGNVAGNNANKYHYKKPAPDFVMGLTSSFNYKSFDASFSLRANIGNYAYNNLASERANYSSLYNQSGFFNNLPTMVTKTEFVNPQYWSDYFIENASFLRMDNISVGYSFDKFFTDKLKARLSATVQNAFVITKYSGMDPEVDGGIDNNIYPRARVFVVGLNITL